MGSNFDMPQQLHWASSLLRWNSVQSKDRRGHVLLLTFFLCAFRSTTMTVMLSRLPFWRALFERYSAAAWAAGSVGPGARSDGSEARLPAFFLCHMTILLRARSQASSLLITSHRPSLASTRHSSSFALGMNMTSGSGIIQGFRYLSPECSEEIIAIFRPSDSLMESEEWWKHPNIGKPKFSIRSCKRSGNGKESSAIC